MSCEVLEQLKQDFWQGERISLSLRAKGDLHGSPIPAPFQHNTQRAMELGILDYIAQYRNQNLTNNSPNALQFYRLNIRDKLDLTTLLPGKLPDRFYRPN